MSLDVCTSGEDHFIVQMREKATGKVHNVECVHDLDFFYTGYLPHYRLLFKDEWEIVRRVEPQPQSKVLTLTATIGGTLVLIAIIGCIVNALAR